MIRFLLILGFSLFGLITIPVECQTSAPRSNTPFLWKSFAEHEIDLEQTRIKTVELLKNLHQRNPRADEDLIFGYWAIEHVFQDEKITSHWMKEGHWIKFFSDFTYQIGIMDDVVTLGSYFYDKEGMMLIMRDAQSDQQPKAWRMSIQGTDASMVGRPILGVTNSKQIKLTGIYKRPSLDLSK